MYINRWIYGAHHDDERDEDETHEAHDETVGGQLPHKGHKDLVSARQVIPHLRVKE